LPPVATQSATQSGAFELALREMVAQAAMELAAGSHIRILNSSQLDRVSPLSERRDVRTDLISGFPYSGTHAAILAALLATLLFPRPSMKGLITDLDGTLWKGIVGEVGPAEVSWDLEHGAQIHGLYQQVLDALSSQGALLAVASKNEPDVVRAALRRPGLLVGMDRFHPVEVHWNPKSQSVSRIIKAWNIGAESIVFVDDNPAELAEVQAVHPEVECILFPSHDPAAAYGVLQRIRNLFGKSFLTEEDQLRQQSLRTATDIGWSLESANQHTESFLEQANSELIFSYLKEPGDQRPLELVNKTNQFNLNGVRITPVEWHRRLGDSRYVVQVARYSDKFGALGRISVLTGMLMDSTLLIDTWVLSCRAFNRRIEDQCLRQLFELFRLSSLRFQFRETVKNTPVRTLLERYAGAPLTAQVELSRKAFFAAAPTLFHKVSSTDQVVANGEYA
jgi:FkbH-like protein